MKIVSLLVIMSVGGFLQASDLDHLALLVLESQSASGATTPTAAATTRFELGLSGGKGHRRSVSHSGLVVTAPPKAKLTASSDNLTTTDSNSNDPDEKKGKDFRKTSAVEGECNECWSCLGVMGVLGLEKLILLGLL